MNKKLNNENLERYSRQIVLKDIGIHGQKKISLSNQKFISRDDNSGTHIKENDLWKLANINLFDNRKYIKTGTSMANTLNVASEMNAYTLSDKGTWISFKNKNVYSRGMLQK